MRIPRSVGATSVVPDMSRGPIPWWHLSTGRPLWQTFEQMRDDGLTAVACLLRAHPTENIYENIRKAFRKPEVDVIVITPFHWASTEWNYEMTVKNIRWTNWPPDIFEMLYSRYAGQEKTIIVQSPELDWQVAGIGCRADDRCIRTDGRYARYFQACQEGTLAPYWQVEGQVGCETIAASMVKLDRAAHLLRIMNARQEAAETAREKYKNASLRVYNAAGVNFFTNEFYLVVRDLIPQMSSPPDLVGLSLYKKGGDPIAAFENTLAWTGLPAERVYVAEVGAREGTQRDGKVITGAPQYDRIFPIVNELFDRGSPLAMVWSWEEVAGGGGHTGYAVNDAVTGAELSGRRAIEDLNLAWRNQ